MDGVGQVGGAPAQSILNTCKRFTGVYDEYIEDLSDEELEEIFDGGPRAAETRRRRMLKLHGWERCSPTLVGKVPPLNPEPAAADSVPC
jgi:hypothetical protein